MYIIEHVDEDGSGRCRAEDIDKTTLRYLVILYATHIYCRCMYIERERKKRDLD